MPYPPHRKLRDDVPPDTGCDLAPSCLSCPFPSCRYDAPNGRQSLRRQEKIAHLQALVDQGFSYAAISRRTGIDRRQISRLLRSP